MIRRTIVAIYLSTQFMSKMMFLPFAALALLGGCAKTPADPVAPATPATPATSASAPPGGSWELVTLERSDPANIYTTMTKEVSYAMCVTAAEVRKIPVKPFPQVPDDYEDKRVTRITNGVSTVIIEESMGGEQETLDIEQKGDCQYTLKTARSKVVTISHAGTSTVIIDGKVSETNEIPPWPEHAPRGQSTTDYSVARTINGVQLRCLPANFWTLNTNNRLDARELCVYHLDNVMVDESGDPVIVRSHVLANILGAKYAHMVKMEPQSMRQIASNEKDPYQVATWVK